MEFEFEVVEHIGIVAEHGNGYQKQLNLVSFGGNEPKYDLRTWGKADEEGKRKMMKGITMTKEELKELKKLLEGLV